MQLCTISDKFRYQKKIIGMMWGSRMSINKNIFAICAVMLVSLLTGCGSNAVKQLAVECGFPDAPAVPAPMWICTEVMEGATVAAVGSAEKSSAGLSFMENMASTDARVQLAQSVKFYVQNMVKQYAESTGAASIEIVDKVNASVTKQITEQTLEGARIFNNASSPTGTYYVLLGMDKNVTAETARDALKASMDNDAALWQQFKVEKGQDELAAEIMGLSH